MKSTNYMYFNVAIARANLVDPHEPMGLPSRWVCRADGFAEPMGLPSRCVCRTDGFAEPMGLPSRCVCRADGFTFTSSALVINKLSIKYCSSISQTRDNHIVFHILNRFD